VISPVVILAVDVLIWWWCGWAGLTYVLFSMLAGVGLHALGAGWIQEHCTSDEGQETYSSCGILNRVGVNIGDHNEHHDLGKVPCLHLPRINAIAPEFNDHLPAYRSWPRVLRRFLFDSRADLFPRITGDRDFTRAQRNAAAA
jgi:sphingolipid delta-4 desaturase